MPLHYLGIDVGAETIRLVGLRARDQALEICLQREQPHGKDPQRALGALLQELALREVRAVAATGRLGRVLRVEQMPSKAALRLGVRVAHPELEELTVISIGAHGFSVLELHDGGREWFQQNARCSQGTGNFLSQLVERFGLSIEQASELCDRVSDPAALSGRCPVILKTDMTHLANKGEERGRILAGLYDAVSENVLSLVRPRFAPRQVVLSGGVARSQRIRRTIAHWLSERGMRLCEPAPQDGHLEALGAAFHASRLRDSRPFGERVEELLGPSSSTELERVPALKHSLGAVRRLPRSRPPSGWDAPRRVVLGFDIGSTGSKAVAVDSVSGDVLWEAYRSTEGAPVQAAQRLVERWQAELGDRAKVIAAGATGSGREIVGSLLRTCYGIGQVFVMNEIAAHARGAVSIDPEVDTIFEIGGQDAKYIRLEGGRVIDAAMNEACSAGTGSFIAEQGAKLEGVGSEPAQMGTLALAAEYGVSLGQHCSVFMAEVIDEAITQGEHRHAIMAGLFDSIIQNYLNRVKGSRDVGRRVFCQGMPFSSEALAAAVARQTGQSVVVPPNPGTIGALGIALLTWDGLREKAGDLPALDLSLFLTAAVRSRETFACRSARGCGGSGNKCRIERLDTLVRGVPQRFVWGGNCSLYDRGVGRSKLPDRAPDPFREREALVDRVLKESASLAGGPLIAMTDEFSLKGHAPLFATFLRELGFECKVWRNAGTKTLKRGIEAARVPYCAPMQLYHGVFVEMLAAQPDFVFVPLLRSLPRVADGDHGELCPIVLAAPDILEGITPPDGPRILRPVIEFDGQGYEGARLRDTMRDLARELGALGRFEAAFDRAVAAQVKFEQGCLRLGNDALDFCRREGIVPVVVQGRPYTIYNDVLNSNVPSLLRSLGAVAVPVDCLSLTEDPPAMPNQYWGYTQRNLRAAHAVRRAPGVYSVFCSNYACGPDSFGLHFFTFAMSGKPFSILETDGHSGDAGTKTRLEAFLYCVDTDLKSGASRAAVPTSFAAVDNRGIDWAESRRRNALALLPRMSENAEVAAAALRSEGIRAEALPLTSREDIRTGRQHTSGKECVPAMITLGALLNRARKPLADGEKVTFFMPTTRGPCRFGVYHSLHKLTFEKLGLAQQVEIVSPDDTDYFAGMSPGFTVKLWLGFLAHDLLQAMLYDVRPAETSRGAANAIFARYFQALCRCMELPRPGSVGYALGQLVGGMYGVRAIIRDAARAFSEVKKSELDLPCVALVGEIYVRLDPFANDFIVDKLEQRGMRVRMAPFTEWLEYTTWLGEQRLIQGRPLPADDAMTTAMTGLVQRTTVRLLYDTCAQTLGWHPRSTVEQAVETSLPFVSRELEGEAQLTLGGPLHEFRQGRIQGVVIVGPHECMPCKIAETQFGKVVETTTIPYLSVPLNGDPIDTEVIDRFTFDVHELHAGGGRRTMRPVAGPESVPREETSWSPQCLRPDLLANWTRAEAE